MGPMVTGSLNGTLAIAQQLSAALGRPLATAARLAYTDGMNSALAVVALAVLICAVVVMVTLPRHIQMNTSVAQAASGKNDGAHSQKGTTPAS